MTAGFAHNSMEPRTAMAYWRGGKCFLHGSSQSQTFMTFGMARYIGIKPHELVYIAEFSGGRSRPKCPPLPGSAYPAPMSIEMLPPACEARPSERFCSIPRGIAAACSDMRAS